MPCSLPERVDDEVMFLTQSSRKIHNVDPWSFFTQVSVLIGTILGKKVETGPFHPFVDECVRCEVSLVSLVEAFFEYVFELLLEGEDVAMLGAWSATSIRSVVF